MHFTLRCAGVSLWFGLEPTRDPLGWTRVNGVEVHFRQLRKPTANAFIEAFNGRFRQEGLNENWFLSL